MEKVWFFICIAPGNAKNFPFAVVNICRIWYITCKVIVEWNFLTNISSLTQNIVHRFRVLPCHGDGWSSANPAGLWNPVENFGKKKSLAIFKRANFERCGLQKYEQPTKVFCLSENLGEYFSEIKSPSNLKKFCHFERRDVISQICSTSTIYKFSRVQSSMIELFVFIVICGCTAMVYSKLILLLFSQ